MNIKQLSFMFDMPPANALSIPSIFGGGRILKEIPFVALR